MSRHFDNGKPGNTVGTLLRRLGRGCICLTVAAATLPRPAAADEPFCDREQIQHRAYRNAKSNKPRDTAASYERELAACKDKLNNRDYLALLIQIVRMVQW